jgi:hypothetical protein
MPAMSVWPARTCYHGLTLLYLDPMVRGIMTELVFMVEEAPERKESIRVGGGRCPIAHLSF